MLFFKFVFTAWMLGIVSCVIPNKIGTLLARILLTLGCIIGVMGAISLLPLYSTLFTLPLMLMGQPILFILSPQALWLMGFGLFPAIFACWFSYLTHTPTQQRAWLIGTGFTLLGALGVFGLQDAMSFLVAWEMMSLGGAMLLLIENKSSTAHAVLFMLGLLEVGAIALVIAFLLLSRSGSSIQFLMYTQDALLFSPHLQLIVGLLLLIGFGAKLGLLPFYEWLPNAYALGSGSTGNLFSGIILNAAFFGLVRGLFSWLPNTAGDSAFGVIVVIIGVLTAIFTISQGFQQNDWRRLLSFSTAENAAISVMMVGCALLFRQAQLSSLAGLAGMIALIHLAGHSLAKGTLFMTADAVFLSTGNYRIQQNGLLKQLGWLFGIGALFGAMSLSAMPPQAGFVSEWYAFQVIFHGFDLHSLSAKLTFVFAGAGLALTAALALATFVKAFGVGLLGAKNETIHPIPFQFQIGIFMLGLSILVLAVGMVRWLGALHFISLAWFSIDSTVQMHEGLILIPLSDHFAFISPALLVMVGPLLALIPIIFLLLARRRYAIRRAPVWLGGMSHDLNAVATTASTFSNAMLTFYRFIYLPTKRLEKISEGRTYFIKSVSFKQKTTPLFKNYLFEPVVRFISACAEKIRVFQSGDLNFYNAIIGVLFILILCCIVIS